MISKSPLWCLDRRTERTAPQLEALRTATERQQAVHMAPRGLHTGLQQAQGELTVLLNRRYCGTALVWVACMCLHALAV